MAESVGEEQLHLTFVDEDDRWFGVGKMCGQCEGMNWDH